MVRWNLRSLRMYLSSQWDRTVTLAEIAEATQIETASLSRIENNIVGGAHLETVERLICYFRLTGVSPLIIAKETSPAHIQDALGLLIQSKEPQRAQDCAVMVHVNLRGMRSSISLAKIAKATRIDRKALGQLDNDSVRSVRFTTLWRLLSYFGSEDIDQLLITKFKDQP